MEVGSHPSELAVHEDNNKQPITRDSTIDQEDSDDKQHIAPDQFDERYQTTKWEIWAYYAWVIN